MTFIKKPSSYFSCLLLVFTLNFAAKAQLAHLEPAKICKTDPKLITISGYLVVPENRKNPEGNKVKIPFVFVRRPDQSATQHVSLYTTGGPGYSTTANIDSIAYGSGFLKYGGFIAFDQRGTKRAIPCLDCDEVEKAIQKSYREGINRDSLVAKATTECRERLMGKGINLSSYTTLESAEDINDLRLALKLDSLNLVGISYSGGLMLTVAKLHPEAVRRMILNSPLPSFVSYEDRGLTNINEALNQVFANCKADSAENYKTIDQRFHTYFSALGETRFKLRYLERGAADSLTISYGKSELLEVIIDRLNTNQVKEVPKIIDDLIAGNHKDYLTAYLDGIFKGNAALSMGMRYSIYCSEQIAYSSSTLLKKEESSYPWLKGYRFNNVNKMLCDCWKVAAEPKAVRIPTNSTVPVLISAGDVDPWTRPYYNRLIKKTIPNAQLLIFHHRGHGAGFNMDGKDYLQLFMDNPYGKLISTSKDLIIE